MRPCILSLLLLLSWAVNAQSLSSRLDSLLKDYHRKGQLDGTILVARKGKVVYQGHFGYANRQFNIPIGPDTRFPIASITKLYTAVLVMQLQEEKKLDIHQPVSAYLPELLPVAGKKITLQQLLLHSSGLPGDKVADYYARSTPRPANFIRKNVKDSTLFEPGSRFRYNNVDYILLGAVIEKVTGKHWEQVLKEKVLAPLQLANTGVVVQQDIIPRLAYGYHNYTFGTGTAQDTLFNDETPYFENYATAGSLYATALELLKLDEALYGHKLLSPAALAVMYTPATELGYNKYSRGYPALGSYINSVPGIRQGKAVKVIERRGNINGFNSSLLRCVEDHNTIILLCNTDTGNMEKIGDDILRALYRE
ncbi:CubicO group peptidase, beta-lactamase class C family [Chitinophaga eiseniae]|uniref:CubicO group peptidase, beta-lactamase class C family n=1 Tax=Chitinophaga eiseniae TaxID=634771 RepID=A0A1T4TUS9_9BACT|nr:serine hydrolase domain-containing protein [Chitinophaga eiseniae]SKA44176.1 CubicO group peptidase, beta-lactamase class C family [Chitinophaga eiseniae]